ncbi:hypothetical protein [Novosphingobium sp. KN65.2]|uniref:hypothetical protein n=1 Tax=Novosphingobium sp. KN65.2 TaxID=1478134 RepID=UPI0005E3346D|nr:hypothetical protein [Novosphingobium sp. KN65.2]CDO34930.1 hypothetical protein SPHV1_2170003 [Novosphingobium sp. KN65.2]
MDKKEADELGTYRAVHLTTRPIDALLTDVELLIVGMPAAPDTTDEITARLDDALRSTLAQLRDGGLFLGRFGETLVLDRLPPPYMACSLLVIGMGEISRLDAPAMGILSELAMRSALKLGRCAVGYMVKPPMLNPLPDNVALIAREVMAGVLRAIEAHPAIMRCAVLEWIVDDYHVHSEIAKAAMRRELAEWKG